MLISINGICKNFGEKRILENISLTIENRCRYGLIGVNGAGKSTLLNIIMGNLCFDTGELYKNQDTTIGYLKQNNGLEGNNSIAEEMRNVFSDVINAQNDLIKYSELMSVTEDKNSSKYKKYSELYGKCQAVIDSRDGYNIDVKISTILNGMGFSDKSPDTVINTLSGGEKTRLAIAKLLLEEPNLLILDEPTNHLDFKTLSWLEEYLLSYKGSLLVVSHDRYFLDKITDTIFEIEKGKLYTYKGNYSKYLILKEERRLRLEKEYEAQQNEIEKMQNYIDRNLARASTSNSAKSRIKALSNMERIEKPDSELKPIHLKFTKNGDPYKDVLSISDLDISVGDDKKLLCGGISLNVKRGEKIAIVGDNGIGKSSFLKTVLGIIPYFKGKVEWGKNVTLSYYEQENLNLHQDKRAIDELWDRFPQISETEIRKVLGSVCLSKDDVYKPVSVISGGEKAKLAFCIIMLEKANVIVLDEPTNHLDLMSKEVLEKALCDYDGTLIFVSHDRYLLNKVPDKIIEITKDGIFESIGGFEDYRIKKAIYEQESILKKSVKPQERNNGNYRSKEQRKNDVQKRNRIKELEHLIEDNEKTIAVLEEELTKEEFFSDYVLMSEKCLKIDELKTELDNYYDEWTILSE